MIAYAISDPSTLDLKKLQNNLERFSSKADMILYRNKKSKNYREEAKIFMVEAKKHAFLRIVLHRDYLLAYKLHADGVHLTSTQSDKIVEAKALGLFVLISTHTQEEALLAQKLGADMVTFSPIFSTPNKGEPKGVDALQALVNLLSIGVIALGGVVTQEQIDMCQKSGAKGFASIRYFG
jgi:thiamine-phosphate pyrophosphorylase